MEESCVNNENSLPYDPDELMATQIDITLRDSDELLIDTIQAYPSLFNKSLKDYHNLDVRQNCWAMIAMVLNKSVSDCQKRWGQLRDSFTNEKRRRDKEERSGSGATKRKGFAFYNNMAFLHQHVKRKKTFTNTALCSSLATSSVAHSQQMNVVYQNIRVPPVNRPRAPTLAMTDFEAGIGLFSSLPLTPESYISTPTPPPASSSPIPTPPPASSSPAPPPASISPPMTVPSSPTPSPGPSTSTRSTVFTTDFEAPPRPLSSEVEGRSFVFSKLPYTETSSPSGDLNLNVPAAGVRPPRITTPSRIISNTSCSPSTPRSTYMSPGSSYSSSSDASCSFSMDDSSRFSSARSNLPPTNCYTKENGKVKKCDPVEKSFLDLSAVIRDHFAQKNVVKQPDVKSTATSNAEDVFASLVVSELGKMDDETKKTKKARIIQILYE